ncbi:TPA: hypothetical protein ACGO9G_000811 [Streptococcus suis]
MVHTRKSRCIETYLQAKSNMIGLNGGQDLMTKIIGFGRCFGKTTMAILESHATGNQIICANNRIAKHTSDYARQLGYTIPQPVVANDQNMPIITSNLNRAGLGVVVDDVEMVLRTLLGCKIDTITFDSPNVISTEDRYAEEITELKKELAACYREKEEDQAIIETLKDKCVDLMLENADYVWDEIARETAKQRANTRKWRAK